MEYSEIEVGKTYLEDGYERHVKYKNDCTRQVVASCDYGLVVWSEDDYKIWCEKLPETGLLISENGSLIYRTGESDGYGFDNDVYVIGDYFIFYNNPVNWRTATNEEESLFVDKLKKEAKRRGLHEETKLKNCLKHGDDYKNIRDFTPIFDIDEGWNRYGCIFFEGKWAQPLEEEEPNSRIDELIKELRAECSKHGFDLDVIIKTR